MRRKIRGRYRFPELRSAQALTLRGTSPKTDAGGSELLGPSQRLPDQRDPLTLIRSGLRMGQL